MWGASRPKEKPEPFDIRSFKSIGDMFQHIGIDMHVFSFSRQLPHFPVCMNVHYVNNTGDLVEVTFTLLEVMSLIEFERLENEEHQLELESLMRGDND